MHMSVCVCLCVNYFLLYIVCICYCYCFSFVLFCFVFCVFVFSILKLLDFFVLNFYSFCENYFTCKGETYRYSVSLLPVVAIYWLYLCVLRFAFAFAFAFVTIFLYTANQSVSQLDNPSAGLSIFWLFWCIIFSWAYRQWS